jgi:hypothetical protein
VPAAGNGCGWLRLGIAATGPEVSGPILSLVMAMTGRTAVLADLTGDGVATLRSGG